MSSYINRDTSFTESEKLVNELGTKSFLRFWTWPNLFRDQENGKEICDLIIVFGNDLLLISDKKIEFNTAKDINIEWKRWYKKAISKSFAQTKGAERWIREFPNRLFIDKGCTKSFPINFDITKAKFHHILVTHGLEEFLEEKLGYPSLQFTNNADLGDQEPFKIGLINKDDPFVHVFTEKTLSDCLGHFDTAYDFLDYLKIRKSFFKIDKNLYLNAEGDLISLWYESYDESNNSRNIFINEKLTSDPIHISYPKFSEFITRKDFIRKKEYEKNSYIWDQLIESFSFHILNGTSVGTENWSEIHEIESKIRIMAQTNRFQRRLLGEGFIDMFYKFKNKRGTRAILVDELNQVFLFFCLPFLQEFRGNTETYRDIRRQMLTDYAYIYKYLQPTLRSLVLIGFRSAIDNEKLTSDLLDDGNDFAYISFDNWDENDAISAKETHDSYTANRLFSGRNITFFNANEFNKTTKF
ncbi:hypothetical protein [Acinetobacter chinensis]|uniref:hypothetical protein n=1 Tax=Acinetobacter chinensis TaxID=2004650 RepID=UPI0029347DF3|nr:hypothetical protein [Acinetobacter chinensis]WOE42068.1 hypothetical protein QSG87_02665 [Acinetobacter chinensis]